MHSPGVYQRICKCNPNSWSRDARANTPLGRNGQHGEVYPTTESQGRRDQLPRPIGNGKCSPWRVRHRRDPTALCRSSLSASAAQKRIRRNAQTPKPGSGRQHGRWTRAANFKDGPLPACGPPSAEATRGGPEPFALRPKAAFWRRVGGRRPEGFGPQGGGAKL
jgi:hypothetical protein